MGTRDIKKLTAMGVRVFKVNILKKTVYENRCGKWVQYGSYPTRIKTMEAWNALMEMPTFISG